MESTISLSDKAKKVVGIAIALSAPFLHADEELAIHFSLVYYSYLAFLFYDIQNVNVRFVILIISFYEILNELTGVLQLTFTSMLLDVSRVTDFYATFAVEIVTTMFAILLLFARSNIMKSFREYYEGTNSYKILGVERIIIFIFIGILGLHVVTLVWSTFLIWSADPSGMLQTSQDLYGTVLNKLLNWYAKLYSFALMLQILALQSYSYSYFNKLWKIDA